MHFGTFWNVWAPKKLRPKVLVKRFPYLFHIKTKWNIVYIYLAKNKNLFKRQISFPKCIEHQIFLDPQLQLLRDDVYHLTIQSLILNFKEMVCSKNVWMQHCVSPTFLNTGTTNETFQQSGKQDSFRHILRVRQVYMKD